MRTRKLFQALSVPSISRLQNLKSLSRAVEELAKCYKDIDRSSSTEEEHELLKTAVRKSLAISTMGNGKSLEEDLKSLGFNVVVYQSREILEIDKISRYLVLCKDIIRFSRRHPLFNNIMLEHCNAPQAVQPVGSIKPCHVHGEVQLILYYEQNSHHPPPRAIGSSKSACLLCDLFIRKHGKYHVLHSHKRLYHQWTIPDVNWMTKQQVSQFWDTVQAMNAELLYQRRTCERQVKGKFNGFESRAHLLFPARLMSAISTPSEISQCTELSHSPSTTSVTPPESQSNAITDRDTVGSAGGDISVFALHIVSVISLLYNNLLYIQRISLTTPSRHLQIDNLSVTFIFVAVLSGSLSIIRPTDIAIKAGDYESVNIPDIPTNER